MRGADEDCNQNVLNIHCGSNRSRQQSRRSYFVCYNQTKTASLQRLRV